MQMFCVAVQEQLFVPACLAGDAEDWQVLPWSYVGYPLPRSWHVSRALPGFVAHVHCSQHCTARARAQVSNALAQQSAQEVYVHVLQIVPHDIITGCMFSAPCSNV